MSLSNSRSGASNAPPSVVKLPAPTAWPITLSFGVTLLMAGLVTSLSVMILGVILVVVGSVGWFLDVFPHEQHAEVPVVDEPVSITTARPTVARLETGSSTTGTSA